MEYFENLINVYYQMAVERELQSGQLQESDHDVICQQIGVLREGDPRGQTAQRSFAIKLPSELFCKNGFKLPSGEKKTFPTGVKVTRVR
jgi:hypothetical protein